MRSEKQGQSMEFRDLGSSFGFATNSLGKLGNACDLECVRHCEKMYTFKKNKRIFSVLPMRKLRPGEASYIAQSYTIGI